MTPGGTFNRKTWNNASSLLLTISPIRYPGPANFLSVLSFHSTNERCNFHPIDHRRLRCLPLFANEMLREKRREVANLINSLPRIQQSSFFFLSRKKWKSLACRFERMNDGKRLILVWPIFKIFDIVQLLDLCHLDS